MTAERHGTHSWYSNHKCRCEACRVANTEYYRGLRERRGQGQKPPRRSNGPAYKGWTSITRDQVAWVCERHGKSIDYNPAARAAFIYAAQVVREAGSPDDIVLRPYDYLQSAPQTERTK